MTLLLYWYILYSPLATANGYLIAHNINIYLTSLILTAILFAPNLAKEAENSAEDPAKISPEIYAFEAPRTPFLTLEEYAEIVAKETKINPDKFRGLIECESNWEETAQGDSGNSIGVLQFKKETFRHFSQKYGLYDLERQNPYNQIDLAAMMIKNGYVSHWKNCAKKTGWNNN